MNTATRIAPPEARLMVSTLVVWGRGGEITEEEEEVVGGFQALLVSVVRVVMDRLAGGGGSGGRAVFVFVDPGCELAAGRVFEGIVLEDSWGAVGEADIEGGVDSKGIRGTSFVSRCGTSSTGCVASSCASGAGVVLGFPAVTVEETVMVTGGISSSLGGVQ